MTVYYLVYDSLGLASERIGNFRSDNKTLNDNLANGVEYLVKRVPNELLDSSSACILEFTEVKPRVIQNTQATADVKAARVLEEFENGVLPSVQRVKLKAETHPTDRAIAEWIVGEKTKHASIVSRAYDTGEAGSLEKYTDEVQSIVRMTLEAIKPEPSTQASCAIPGVSQKTRYKCVICDHEELRHHDGSAPIRQVCSICGVSSLFQITDDVWR